MIVTCVYIHVKPEYVEDFILATLTNHESSILEPGNLRFDVLQESVDKTRFTLYEAYESEEAAAAHKNTPHYQKWRQEVENWMAEPRKGVRHNVICPIQRSKW